MRVGLDATPLTLTSGGLQRYVACLHESLCSLFSSDTFELFHQPQTKRDLHDRFWWLIGIRRALRLRGIDVFHGTNFEVPYTGASPAVMTIHDLSPWRDSAWHRGADRVRKRTPWMIRTGRVARVITPSNAIRTEVIERFSVPPERVHVTPLAASPIFQPVDSPPVHPRPFFLFVGTLEPRKNLPGLIDAWQGAGTGFDLVLIGRKRADAPKLPEVNGLCWKGECTDQEIAAHYSQALAFVYPSFYEGFGLPVLEAMQCGCPVITSRDPAITEVSRDAALQATTNAELQHYLQRIALGGSLRENLRCAGLKRSTEFSWSRTARLTCEIYRETISH